MNTSAFWKPLAILTGACAALVAILYPLLHFHTAVWGFLLFYALLTAFLYPRLQKARTETKHAPFLMVVTTNMGMRMLGSLAVLLVYLFRTDNPHIPTIIVFIVLYLVYSFFETWAHAQDKVNEPQG